MLKVADALHRWVPNDGATDPRTALELSWAEIVGPHVADNSHPSRITGDTVLVTTRSSSWSHQLTLLAESILAAIAVRLPDAGIKRLRFRVGSLPQRRSATAPGRVRWHQSRGAVPRPQAASADEALRRFRRDVEQSERSKATQGWRRCAQCAAFVPPLAAAPCVSCTASTDERRVQTIARLLFEAPWLGYSGTAELVEGLYEGEYERIRAQLLARWWSVLTAALKNKRLSYDRRERLIASSYVLLRSNVPPDEIIPATVRGILGDELHHLIYDT